MFHRVAIWLDKWQHRLCLTTRRGAAIFMLGLIYLVIGWADLTQPIPKSTNDVYAMAINVMSIHNWGLIWLGVGLAGTILPILKRTDLGFFIMALFTSLWSAMGFGSTFFFHSERGWVGGFTWAIIAMLIYITAGLRNPA